MIHVSLDPKNVSEKVTEIYASIAWIGWLTFHGFGSSFLTFCWFTKRGMVPVPGRESYSW
jgi:hypothetical protein